MHMINDYSYATVQKLDRILFFQNYFIFLVLLFFHIFWNNVSTEYLVVILIAIEFNLCVNLGRINISSMFILLLHDNSMSLLLFWFSFISSSEFCVFSHCWVKCSVSIFKILLVNVELFCILADFQFVILPIVKGWVLEVFNYRFVYLYHQLYQSFLLFAEYTFRIVIFTS